MGLQDLYSGFVPYSENDSLSLATNAYDVDFNHFLECYFS